MIPWYKERLLLYCLRSVLWKLRYLVFFQAREAGGSIKAEGETLGQETGGSRLALAHFVGCVALY
jgi:hypothetical protein